MKKRSIWLLAPLFGIILYALLYFIATLFYPGGSQFDEHSKGFSWTHNYWCNLLNETAINGKPNPARPIAMIAMAILALTLIIFWYIFPKYIPVKISGKIIIQGSGFLSMIIGLFLSTSMHDIVINIASVFGVIAIVGTFIGLYKLKWRILFWIGLFILPLIALNNILYHYTDMFYLPIVQRITFLYVLGWVALVDLKLYNYVNTSLNLKSKI